MRSFSPSCFADRDVLKFAPSSRAEEFICPVTKLVPITFEPVTLHNSRANLLGTEKLYTIFSGNWTIVQRMLSTCMTK
jgi:hypothetical protein